MPDVTKSYVYIFEALGKSTFRLSGNMQASWQTESNPSRLSPLRVAVMHKMKRVCRVGNQADISSFRKQITHCTSFPTFFVTVLTPSNGSLLRGSVLRKRVDSRKIVD